LLVYIAINKRLFNYYYYYNLFSQYVKELQTGCSYGAYLLFADVKVTNLLDLTVYI
jgi:hypothetical protein